MPITLSTNQIKFNHGNEYVSAALFKDLKIINPSGYVTPETFGAVGDGITDDTVAWKDAIASGQVIVATGRYLCTEPLELNNDTFIYGIIYNDVSDGVKIIEKRSHTYVVRVASKTEHSGSQFSGVEIRNTNDCSISVYSQNFYKGLLMSATGTGCCYNHIDSLLAINAMYAVYLYAENSGWVNENWLYNIRAICNSSSLYDGLNYGIFTELDSSSSHSFDSDHFYNCGFEDAYCAVCFNQGNRNTVNNVRTEACDKAAIFGTGAHHNIVYVSYGTSSKTDNGSNNAVITIGQIISKFSE